MVRKKNGVSRYVITGLSGLLLLSILLGPWMARNQQLSGRLVFSSMGDMGMLHGRLGGLESYRQGLGTDEGILFRLGDSLAVQQDGLQGYREYYSQKQTHETELYRKGGTGITIRYFLSHPWEAIQFQGRSLIAMLKGVGFGWSRQVTGSQPAAYMLAGLQLLANLLMYAGLLWGLWKWRKWPSGLWMIALGVALLLLVSNAAWADGRYRMVIDPLFLIIGAGTIRRLSPNPD